VRTLLAVSPMRLFASTPLYNWYLRLLGARIGKDAVLLNGGTVIASDMISIGDGAFVSRTATMPGYRARSGYIEIGPLTIGARAFVGEAARLSIGSTIGDDAQLGNTSALYSGQAVPAGKRYHGSPAIETTTNYDRVEHLPVSRLRRALYNLFQLVSLFLLAPIPVAIGLALFPSVADLGAAHLDGQDVVTGVGWATIAGGALAAAFAAVIGVHLTQMVAVYAVPRLLNPLLKPGRVYALYGFHYFVYGVIRNSGHSGLLKNLFGDSSFITGLLQFIGWDLGKVVQTGSGLGVSQPCDIPQLTKIGTGTMVADGLIVLNSDYSATSFRVGETRIGANNYLGNVIAYPADGRTGDNVLLGTKVLVPIDGPIRENTGLLGSPAFEIPRLVKRDTEFDELKSGDEYARRLKGKNRSNLVTMGLYLLSAVVQVFVPLFVFAFAIAEGSADLPLRLAGAGAIALIFSALYGALMEHLTLGFRPLEPKTVSIYDPYFWSHERHWKVASPGFAALFNGTPFKGLAWRLLGVKVGKRLFDDGGYFTERSLVSLGDFVTLNAGSVLQSHTLEEGTFKSGMITLGDDVTVGTNGYINYDAAMGDGARLEADSFLMKGERVPAGSIWGGNPARILRG
jgi:non-ribosomal peptide synthetase-like protein